ncbi:MAG: serine protease [Thermoleophilaceae bacterium]|nr:serine protease [Thermoleophilaceae bacterium]
MRIHPLLPALATAVLLALPGSAWAADAVPGEVVVGYESGATSLHTRIERATGTSTEQRLPGDAKTLDIRDGESVRKTIAELRRHDEVRYAHPNWRVHASDFLPDDPGRGAPGDWTKLQWNFTGSASVNAPAAWDLARQAGAPGGKGVIVAVIDSGVAYESRGSFRRAPDLGRTSFVPGYDWVSRDRHPDDEESHGTHVAGIIAQQTNNGVGLTGLAYGVKIMPLRVLDRHGFGDFASIASAIRFAANHRAKVVNMSVEGDAGLRAADIPEVISAMVYAQKRGVVLVAASGNEGDGSVAYPARAPQVIAVGGTTADACLADYSNYGRGLDIVAPGGGADAALFDNARDRASCNPDIRARDVYQQTFVHNFRTFGLVGQEGTSFAAPHVSAAAALLVASGRIGHHPSPKAVAARLEATARDLGVDGYDTRYGWGLLDAAKALAP